MTGKAIGKIEASELRPFAEDGIAIQGVDGVKAGPSSHHLERVKGRHKLRKRRPDPVNEPFLIPAEIETHRIILKGPPEQDQVSRLSPEVKP
jgi:hypothetical protein